MSMNPFARNKGTPPLLEAFASGMAARRFHKTIPDLTPHQKYAILTEYVKMKLGEAWDQAGHKAPRNYFLSFEYAFGKPTRYTEQALGLAEDLDALAKLLGSDYPTLLEEEDLPNLGYGTPGRFGAAWMEASTETGLPTMGYGLRYRSGFIAQYIIRNRPVEATDYVGDPDRAPWEIPTELRYPVHFNGETVVAEAFDYPIPGNGGKPIHYVRLWDVMESSRIDTAEFRAGEYVKAYHQAIEPRRLVEFLYPSETNEPGKKLRLMQEYFFASATIQDILAQHSKDTDFLTNPPEIYLNEIHPTLAIPETIRLLTEKYGWDFEKSAEWVWRSFCYGNQILTDEAFESWPLSLLASTVPVLLPVLQKMDAHAKKRSERYASQRESTRGIIRDEQLILSNLCLYFCREVFAFSDSHQKYLAKRMGMENEEEQICVLEPRLAYIKTLQRVSPGMYDCLKEDNCSVEKLAREKMENKRAFAETMMDQSLSVNPYSIFSVHIGNFHENNRQLMILLYIADLHRKLKMNPHLDIPDTTFIFSGLAYPGYLMATETVHLINAYGKWLRRDTLAENKLRIVFLEDINPETERHLLAISDIYQAIRLPAHATLPMYVPEAILHGAAVFSSRNGYTEKLAESFTQSAPITLFNENDGEGDGRETLRFILRNKGNLDFDAATISSILTRYNDSFSVLGSFESYRKEMTKLTRSYLQGEEWKRDRAVSQRQMWQLLKNREDITCAGR